jgi:hypothetical protein
MSHAASHSDIALAFFMLFLFGYLGWLLWFGPTNDPTDGQE